MDTLWGHHLWGISVHLIQNEEPLLPHFLTYLKYFLEVYVQNMSFMWLRRTGKEEKKKEKKNRVSEPLSSIDSLRTSSSGNAAASSIAATRFLGS